MNTNVKIFVSIILLLIVGVVVSVLTGAGGQSSNNPGKYDSFAQCLKDKGVTFYGAFWCPHCQAQEKAFGMSRQKLEKLGLYVECSTQDTTDQTQICKDKKVESYPTWTFSNPIKFTSDSAPTICVKGSSDPECANRTSEYAKIWIFNKFVLSSVNEPVQNKNEWTFDTSSQVRGELTFDKLSEQTGCVLP